MKVYNSSSRTRQMLANQLKIMNQQTNAQSIHNIGFVPFIKERDHMGRLIKVSPNKYHQNQKKTNCEENYRDYDVELSSKLRILRDKDIKDQVVQQMIEGSFQYKSKNVIFTRPGNKIKIRKNSISIPKRKLSDQIWNKANDEDLFFSESVNKNFYGVKTQENSPLLRKKLNIIEESLVNSKISCNTSQIKYLQRQISNKQSSQIKSKQQIFPKFMLSSKKTQNKLFKKSLSQKATQQIQQLNHYNSYKSLQIRLAPNVQESLKRFHIKMIQSKQLTYTFKLNIQAQCS